MRTLQEGASYVGAFFGLLRHYQYYPVEYKETYSLVVGRA